MLPIGTASIMKKRMLINFQPELFVIPGACRLWKDMEVAVRRIDVAGL
jgi:hypothetical protein